MDRLKRLGYPLPVHPKLYDFGRFHGYVDPSLDLSYEEFVGRVVKTMSMDREDAKLYVLELLRDDFDEWFWKTFGRVEK